LRRCITNIILKGKLESKQGKIKPSISICIPTFNRGNIVYELVQNLLQYESSDIEVVVLDNCSTDNTAQLISQIVDERLTYVINEINIGGPLNLLKALMIAKAEFAFLCLDKDGLDPKRIKDLISKVMSDPGITYGYCALNKQIDESDRIYKIGYDSLLNMSYLSSHPTGMFYKTSVLNSLPKLKSIFSENEKFAFYPDIVNGEMALTGKSLVINGAIFFTETKVNSAKLKSYTYSDKDLYFTPSQRIVEFTKYGECIAKLNISDNDKYRLVRILFIRGVIGATTGYREILRDKHVCEHYYVLSRDVGITEIIRIYYQYTITFLKSSLPITLSQKLFVSCSGMVGLLKNLIKI
jgi:glycosyltransferase involved in cell wall biosynthesis